MPKRFFAVVVLVCMCVSPVLAQQTDEITQADVDEARAERSAASATLDAVMARFESAVVEEENLRESIVSLSRSVAHLEQEIGARRVEAKDLVVSRYTSGGTFGSEHLFAARTFTDLPVMDAYFGRANDRAATVLRGLEASEALHVVQQNDLDDALEAQLILVEEIGGLADEIMGTLEQADSEYNTVALAFEAQEEEKRRKAEEERLRREEEARQEAIEQARLATSTTTLPPTTTTTLPPTTTTVAPEPDTGTTSTTLPPPAPPPVVTDGRACPINAANSFSDTWGAPRSGGRTHKGVDMTAVRNAPLVAIESGTISRLSTGSLGGNAIYMRSATGSRYYYAHLESFAPGIGAGSAVTVGELIGYNGSSGNAPNWLPHLHFQYAPSGGDWVNPYPLVKALCG